MPNLQKIIKLTQQQYNILKDGGTVGSYTGLNTNYIYLVQDDNQYATEDYVDGAIDDLSTVAKTGSYNDLSNKPTIPTVNNGTLTIQGNGTTASTFTANQSGNTTLNIKGSGGTTVTKSANNEITISTGTIPTVNNGTLTIQRNGSQVATFTANQSGNATANITVPTKVSDLSDASNYINTGDTTQNKTGSLSLGKAMYSARGLTDDPYNLAFLDFQNKTGVIKHLNVFSGVGDWLYCADKKRQFEIKSTFKGSGADSDTYNADFYYLTDGNTWLPYLFNWKYTDGWSCLPSKISSSTPAIIQIKSSSQMTYTDVLKLTLTGHGGYDSSNNYSGILTNYSIEVCTDYTNDTWVKVVDRQNVQDKIGLCPTYSLQLSSYTACYGIRLTITGAAVTGSGYAYIRITSMQLRDHRPGFSVNDAVGCLSQGGGSLYGDLIFDARGTGQTFRPAVTNTGYIGTSSYKWYALYATNVYLSDKVDFGAKVSGRTNTSYIATDNYDGIGFWVNGIRAVNVYDNATYFAKKIVPNSTSVDIGDSTHSWKDLYLSGNYYIGDANNYITKRSETNLIDIYTNSTLSASIGAINTTFKCNILPSGSSKNIGSSTANWKDLYLNGNIYLGTNETYIKGYTDNRIGFAISGSEVAQFTRYNIYFNNQLRGIIAPQTNNNGNIGTSSLVYATTYTNNVSDGTNSISVSDIASKNDLNFLSLDGGTMEGNITTGEFGIPEKTILGDGLEVIYTSSQANVTTHYGAGYIQQDDDENTSIRYEYNFPKKNGTIATTSDITLGYEII